MSDTDPRSGATEMPVRTALLVAALAHVPFDGWSEATFSAAIRDNGVAPGLARALFPRGAVDLALEFHRRGDAEMLPGWRQPILGRFAFVIGSRRLSGTAWRQPLTTRRPCVGAPRCFGLPLHAADGARAIWGTADAIWSALGDTSRDINWYSKRATLSAVYAATVLFWLGDDSPGSRGTWDFLDRRIDDVMRIEKAKASFKANPLGKLLMAVLRG